jgi:hypothetical protein
MPGTYARLRKCARRKINRSSEPASTGPALPKRFHTPSRDGALGRWRPPCHARQKPRVYRVFEATERAGFEPAMEFNPHTRLAGECLQPLGHLSWRSGKSRGCPGLRAVPAQGLRYGCAHQDRGYGGIAWVLRRRPGKHSRDRRSAQHHARRSRPSRGSRGHARARNRHLFDGCPEQAGDTLARRPSAEGFKPPGRLPTQWLSRPGDFGSAMRKIDCSRHNSRRSPGKLG